MNVEYYSEYGHVVVETDSEKLFLEYEPSAVPVRNEGWTRFVCISDTHCRTFQVPSGDVLLHAGDLTNTGKLNDFKTTMEWIYSLPHKVKIIIAGNHDLSLDMNDSWYEKNFMRFGHPWPENRGAILTLLRGPQAVESGVVYLESQTHEFQLKPGGRTWTVYGSPWSPEFYNWAFNYDRANGEEIVSTFPKTDILLTHGPPYKVLDQTTGGDFAGCTALANRVPQLKPRIHLFGHIHEAHGATVHEWVNGTGCPSFQAGDPQPPMVGWSSTQLQRTVFVNAAVWPAGPRASSRGTRQFGGPGFQPVIIDLKDTVV